MHRAAAVEATHQRLLYAALQLPGAVHCWHAVAATTFSIPRCRSGRDPRFDDLTGTLDQDRFKNAYAFLYNEQLPEERQVRVMAARRCCSMACQQTSLEQLRANWLAAQSAETATMVAL